MLPCPQRTKLATVSSGAFRHLISAPFLCSFLLLVLGLLYARPAFADEVVFTLPNCEGYNYPVKLETHGPNLLQAPVGHLYCEASKLRTSNNYALTEAIDQALGTRTVVEVDIAAHYFVDESFADWLCSLSWADDGQIRIYHQHWESGVSHVSTEFYRQLRACGTPTQFLPLGCDIFDDSAAPTSNNSSPSRLCKYGSVNLLHANIGRFLTTNGESIIFTGSGNINKSLYANIDDWLILERSKSEPLSAGVECIFATLKAFTGRINVPVAEFRSKQKSCLETASLTNVRTAPQLILTPLGGTKYFSTVIADIADADSVWIASQFLGGDKRIIDALSQKTQGDVRILLDDDNAWNVFTW